MTPEELRKMATRYSEKDTGSDWDLEVMRTFQLAADEIERLQRELDAATKVIDDARAFVQSR